MPRAAPQGRLRRGGLAVWDWNRAGLTGRQGEESRLLYEDGNGMQYGSFGDAAMGGDDTVEAQRENEALQRVVAKTSKFVACRRWESAANRGAVTWSTSSR